MPEPSFEESIAETKRRVNLVNLVRSYGVELKASGRNYLGHCPFHKDRTASFVVTPSKGLWHCMGACNKGGSALDFVMGMEKVNFGEALRILEEKSGNGNHAASIDDGLKHSGNSSKEKVIEERKLYHEFSLEERNFLDGVMEYFRESLVGNKEVLSYLRDRRIGDMAILQKFGVGYSDGRLGEKFLSSANTKKGKEERRILTEFGLIREKGFELFRQYILFPVRNSKGEVEHIYGRQPMDREKERRHRYLPGSHRGIWNREALEEKRIVLCESIIDALTLYCHGVRNVTCTYGTEGYTRELHDGIVSVGDRKVVFAFDTDEAGNSAVLRYSEKLGELGIGSERIRIPMGMDVNSYACKVANPHDALPTLLLDTVEISSLAEKKPDPVEKEVLATERQPDEPQEKESKEEKFEPVAQVAGIGPESIEKETTRNKEKPKRPYSIDAREEEIYFQFVDREYRVRGLYRNQGVETIRVNLRLLFGDEYYTETLDILNQKMRKGYVQNASDATGLGEDTIQQDLKDVIRETEEILWEYLEKRKKPEKEEYKLTDKDREEALGYLQKPDLLLRIVRDMETCGLVGERVNSLIGYLASITRKTENPLAVIIQSSSSAGKSTLMDAVLDLVPEEEKVKYSAMTGQSLFYMPSTNLKYKVLAISEEEGIERAKYALKILQSEKKISIATTSKDPVSGKLATMEYTVEGPVMIFLTTTNLEIDEELQNRAILLTVNEAREQTRIILKNQREEETLEGYTRKRDRDHLTRLHKNIQRVLEPIVIVNPYAREMSFPDTRLRMRRDHKKYLTLIRSIALL
ncbi:MAG: toprim domain-containing protein, partial [Leptospira sp.]|nr:toprim domain-containing protein [Leptospira sp.]